MALVTGRVPQPRELRAIDIASRDMIGYIALSNDNEYWRYYLIEHDGLLVEPVVMTPNDATMHTFARSLPADGLLHFAAPVSARIVRLWHKGGALTAFAPLRADRCWSGVPTFFPDPQPATESTMREVLDELRQLHEQLRTRISS